MTLVGWFLLQVSVHVTGSLSRSDPVARSDFTDII